MTLSSQPNHSTTTPISESSAWGWTSLRDIGLYISLQTDDWKVIIKSMDYSALSELIIRDLSFSMDHFKLLVDCIPANANPVSRLAIHVGRNLKEDVEWSSEVARLSGKVPNVRVLVDYAGFRGIFNDSKMAAEFFREAATSQNLQPSSSLLPQGGQTRSSINKRES
ncbi:hypothetical protein BGZ65_007145 [Modicella reniformis]|uniref:Uncharacterized protein n=1 Tax=Modicella reniformis TaxID=1440133 RepID=A0A9P6SSN0_9FUNG|nr:hypothetical protein BGZ65_007145 [Modicella reniformis]